MFSGYAPLPSLPWKDKGEVTMWENVHDTTEHLSHDMPCHRCGHAMHTFLACSDVCDCEPSSMPGAETRRLLND